MVRFVIFLFVALLFVVPCHAGFISVVPLTDTICVGQNVLLQASGGVSYTWSPGATLSGTTGFSVSAAPLTSTVYKVVGTDGFGNVDSAFVNIVVDVVSVSAGLVPNVCLGSSVLLTGTGLSSINGSTGVSYSWGPNNGTIANPFTNSTLAFPNVSTNYTLTAQSSRGCTQTSTVAVVVDASAIAQIISVQPNDTIDEGENIILKANPGGSAYLWTGNNPLGVANSFMFSAKPTISSTYVLKVTNSTGCVASDSVKIFVYPSGYIKAPNIFTPNGDGNHDTWQLPMVYNYPKLQAKIYNRWGSIVWESDSGYATAWNGFESKTGKPAPDGTYYYILEFNTNRKAPQSGSVTIYR